MWLGYTKLDVPCGTDNQKTKHFNFLQIRGARPCQKLGIFLVINGFKIEVTKNHFSKKSAPKLVSFIEKKIERL